MGISDSDYKIRTNKKPSYGEHKIETFFLGLTIVLNHCKYVHKY